MAAWLVAAAATLAVPGPAASRGVPPADDAAAPRLRATPSVVQAAPAGPAQSAPRRLVAIGDLHADLDMARKAFRLAGATNERDAWIGGSLVVVQMGDLIGRGPDDRAVLDFVLDLESRARQAGGTLHILIGNHEVFAARPDHRWVNPDAFAAFAGLAGLNLRHPRVADLPAMERPRAAALMPGSAYARRLSAFPAVLRVGTTVFAHGGVLPLWARYGVDRLNTDIAAWLAGRGDEPRASQGLDDGSGDDGVMWSRHLAALPEPAACAVADESLAILGARRMIVAHTVQRAIVSRCLDRVWAIDVGISRYYGGDLQVLEILNDGEMRVITEPGR
jgi:hypothetical protein